MRSLFARERLRSTVEGGLWLILALLPLIISDWQIAQFAIFICYGMFAMSLGFIWGQAGLLCFGQAVFFGLGAYAMSLTTLGMWPGQEEAGGSLTGLILALVVPAVFANLLGRFLFHGKGLRGAYLGIVTLAVGVIAERLAVNWDYIGGLNGLMNVPPLRFDLQGRSIELWGSYQLFYLSLGVAFVVFLLIRLLLAGPFGLVLQAIREDEDRAAYLGFDTRAYKVWVFTLGAALAGLAGGLFVTQFNFASPALIGFALSTEVLIWVAVGGRGFLMAAFLGALGVRFLEDQLSEGLLEVWPLILGFLFILVVILLPGGLVGELFARLRRFEEGRR